MVIVWERWRRAVGLTAAGLVAAAGMAGCGDDSSSSDSFSAGGSADRPAAVPLRDGAGEKAADQRDSAEKVTGQDAAQPPGTEQKTTVVDERSIIYTGSITVRIKDDLNVAAERAVAKVSAAGGFVGSDKRTSDDRRSEATLELRVPAPQFTKLVEELAGLGDEETRSFNTEDVTERVVDLDARIATQRASVNRTRALLAQAKTIAEIVSVEGELARREADLSSLEAKKRRLADLTSFSTITLVLLGPEAALPDDDEPDTGFIAGVKGGWEAFLASVRILLTVLGALLPWAIALGLPVYGLVWLLRRLRARRPRPATTASMPSPMPMPGLGPIGPMAPPARRPTAAPPAPQATARQTAPEEAPPRP